MDQFGEEVARSTLRAFQPGDESRALAARNWRRALCDLRSLPTGLALVRCRKRATSSRIADRDKRLASDGQKDESVKFESGRVKWERSRPLCSAPVPLRPVCNSRWALSGASCEPPTGTTRTWLARACVCARARRTRRRSSVARGAEKQSAPTGGSRPRVTSARLCGDQREGKSTHSYLLEHLFWNEQLLQMHVLLQLIQIVYVTHFAAELDAVFWRWTCEFG